MKHSAFLFLLMFITSAIFAQRKVDIGLTGGASYYQGDINPSRLFYSPRYNVGPIVRFNIDERHSIRLHGIYSKLSGSDSDFDYIITKRNNPVTFNVNLINLTAQLEYNFFKYRTCINPGDWTPYMFGGIGYSIILSSSYINASPIANNHVTIPFGVGAKISVTRRLSAGLEWRYNKTFTDRLDGVTPILDSGEKIIYNNDWYSFFNVLITYKFFKFAADCPAYD